MTSNFHTLTERRIALAITFSLALLTVSMGVAAQQPDERIVVPLDQAMPDTLVRHATEVELISSGPQQGLQVRFGVTDWPNVSFRPKQGVWDWTGYAGLAVEVFNPEPIAQLVSMRVDNEGADGANHCNQLGTSIPPGKWTTFRLRFNRKGEDALWGMRGLPLTGPKGGGAVLDLTRITAFQVFLSRPTTEHTLILDNFRLYGWGARQGKVAMPFVDRFGQYRNADWPSKLNSESDFAERIHKEESGFKALPSVHQDKYGGWADGPTFEATGWFRTEKADGRWWLVTPEGRLFFSVGVDCVGQGEQTFIDGRARWFEWLPEETGPFARFIHRQQGAHSMAETIAGEGRVFSFYSANLSRKFGNPWRERWEQTSAARLRHWGFNTIGNWSDWSFMAKARIPFVASGGIAGTARKIEGGVGYWGKMVDVYDLTFAKAAEHGLSGVARHFANNPYCIGYFGDNEIAWEAVERGPLASPPDQPCRLAQVEGLNAKYGSLDKLNSAWGTKAASWEELRVPDQVNAACRQDLTDFQYAFARRYFETCRDVFKRHAPRQLYLGCRFSTAPKAAVRACADVADVVSFNLYYREINPADWTGANELPKPILIGEFHFGALDRGMFHEGLVPCIDQRERARAYADYVRSVVTCPAFVGCHWFQYVDEPITGRWFDGENYNMGMVDVTDTPYPELTDSARTIHGELYQLRSGAPKLRESPARISK
jgi:hypothetical protein